MLRHPSSGGLKKSLSACHGCSGWDRSPAPRSCCPAPGRRSGAVLMCNCVQQTAVLLAFSPAAGLCCMIDARRSIPGPFSCLGVPSGFSGVRHAWKFEPGCTECKGRHGPWAAAIWHPLNNHFEACCPQICGSYEVGKSRVSCCAHAMGSCQAASSAACRIITKGLLSQLCQGGFCRDCSYSDSSVSRSCS
jgi:hypothetical protein